MYVCIHIHVYVYIYLRLNGTNDEDLFAIADSPVEIYTLSCNHFWGC